MKLLRNILPIIFLSVVAMSAFSQSDSIALPLHKQFPTVPAFKLMKADSSFFLMNEVGKKKNKATVVIVFSPTCGHCRQQAEEITGNMKALKDINFIFGTAYPVSDMAAFVSNLGLNKFSNITVGHDKALMLSGFYKMHSLPGIFVYDKKGKFKAEFETNVTTQMLLDALK